MSGLTVGVDLGGTNTRAGAVTETGQVVGRSRRPTPLIDGADAVVAGIAACAREAASDAGISLAEAQGVGVGAPGPLDPFKGVLISPENLQCMHGVRLKDRLEEQLGVSVTVDNDANLAAFGEQWLGAGQGIEHFLCMTLGTGVGGGWVANGSLMHGFNGNAAEVGHVTVDMEGPRCPCGNLGCLELYASATAMMRRTRELVEQEGVSTSLEADGLTTEAIFAAAEDGDAFAAQMFEETGFYLGVGIVSIVNLLNVQTIALAGGLAMAGDRILEPARRTFQDRGTVGVKEYVEIIPAALGDDAGILGAARMAMIGAGDRRQETGDRREGAAR